MSVFEKPLGRSGKTSVIVALIAKPPSTMRYVSRSQVTEPSHREDVWHLIASAPAG